MAAPDAVDLRLLALVADLGRAPVRDVAARLGMEPRDVAARLVALSAAGLPLAVGVDCDPHGLRMALGGAGAVGGYPPTGGVPRASAWPVPPGAGPPPMPAAAPGTAVDQRHGSHRPAAPNPEAPPDPPTSPLRITANDAMRTWGPPQTAAWARGDQPPDELGAAGDTRPGPG